MKHQKILSVIIPCLNEVGVVNVLLDQLLSQTNDSVEIIAVDSRSQDATLSLLKSYEPRGVRVVAAPKKGVSLARNMGAEVASGRWLLFLDADNQMPKDFLPDLLKLLSKKPDITLAAVAYRAKTNNLWFRFLARVGQGYQRLSSYIGAHPIVPGAFTLVKRNLHEAVGGYDETKTYNEDFDYSRRVNARQKGYTVIKHPYVYFSTRRMEHGGWRKMAKVYVRAERARRRGEQFDSKEYDLSDHKMH